MNELMQVSRAEIVLGVRQIDFLDDLAHTITLDTLGEDITLDLHGYEAIPTFVEGCIELDGIDWDVRVTLKDVVSVRGTHTAVYRMEVV